MTQGKYPSLSIGEARDLVTAYRTLLDRGIGPRRSISPVFA